MRCKTETMESLLAFGQNQSIAIIHRPIIPPRPDASYCETSLSFVEESNLSVSEGETR